MCLHPAILQVRQGVQVSTWWHRGGAWPVSDPGTPWILVFGLGILALNSEYSIYSTHSMLRFYMHTIDSHAVCCISYMRYMAFNTIQYYIILFTRVYTKMSWKMKWNVMLIVYTILKAYMLSHNMHFVWAFQAFLLYMTYCMIFKSYCICIDYILYIILHYIMIIDKNTWNVTHVMHFMRALRGRVLSDL